MKKTQQWTKSVQTAALKLIKAKMPAHFKEHGDVYAWLKSVEPDVQDLAHKRYPAPTRKNHEYRLEFKSYFRKRLKIMAHSRVNDKQVKKNEAFEKL